jgi:asparagine synthase (glutamine-hydrolysing)
MGNAIKHRGVSSSITEVDNIKVAFNYLPITDKSAHTQPYVSGKWHVWLNGYISNYKELAEKYRIETNTDCDTEVLAEFLRRFKFSKLKELNGFFSVVCYNGGKSLNFFTDRYGIKQLYSYTKGKTMYFCSEVKGIMAVQNLEVSEFGANEWLHSLGVMNHHTIYRNVYRVGRLDFHKPYEIDIPYDRAVTELRLLFDRSIDRNKVQGLKTGVFLSGGIDSGMIAKSIHPDYCFSMDYEDQNYSEIENIKRNTTGIHMSLICNKQLFLDNIHDTCYVLDDLKAGSSYTNFALTALASKFCTVLYSGAGGDEVFDGYTHRYNKDISEVIKRTNSKLTPDLEHVTHKQYDWNFLRSVLVVEDRMTGHHCMETRYPLLDNDFVDFALSLPSAYRENKKILKDISGLHPEVIAGKKRGFSNPHFTNDQWAKFALSERIQLLKQSI